MKFNLLQICKTFSVRNGILRNRSQVQIARYVEDAVGHPVADLLFEVVEAGDTLRLKTAKGGSMLCPGLMAMGPQRGLAFPYVLHVGRP
jgi:hypothetical protein